MSARLFVVGEDKRYPETQALHIFHKDIAVLILRPRQAAHLPAVFGPAVAVGVFIAFEAFGDVVAAAVAGVGEGPGGGGGALAGAAQQREGLVRGHALGFEFLAEDGVEVHFGEHLPLHRDHVLAEVGEVGGADVLPFGVGAHVHQDGVGVLGEQLPRLLRVDVAGVALGHRLVLSQLRPGRDGRPCARLRQECRVTSRQMGLGSDLRSPCIAHAMPVSSDRWIKLPQDIRMPSAA